MNASQDLERRLVEFYAAEAPRRAPEWVLEGALATIDTTPQRRVPTIVPWGFTIMPTYAKLAVAAVAVIAVGILGFGLVGPRQPGGFPAPPPTPSPTESPRPSPSADPSPSPLPALTRTYTSSLNGISFGYPQAWLTREATEPWIDGIPLFGSEFADVASTNVPSDGDDDLRFIGVTSQPLQGLTFEAWADRIASDPGWDDTCEPATEPIDVDGVAGRLVTRCPSGMPTALVASGDRGYLIVLYGFDDGPSFDGLLDTIVLMPDAAVQSLEPSASP